MREKIKINFLQFRKLPGGLLGTKINKNDFLFANNTGKIIKRNGLYKICHMFSLTMN